MFLSVTGRNVQYKTGCHLERGVVEEEISPSSPPPPQLLPPPPPNHHNHQQSNFQYLKKVQQKLQQEVWNSKDVVYQTTQVEVYCFSLHSFLKLLSNSLIHISLGNSTSFYTKVFFLSYDLSSKNNCQKGVRLK